MAYKHKADALANSKRLAQRNRAFVDEINARTVCAHCGAQPIEWHNPEHVELDRKLYRISRLVGSASIHTIQTEMARCTPLCRRCHMKEDGRLKSFKTNRSQLIGSQQLSAKLTEVAVREIRLLRMAGHSVASLAARYGVSEGAISHAATGRNWSHVE